MPKHDIVDNRNEKLVDDINRILESTEAARFAVGYFFLSGFESIAKKLAGVNELRLLIGNTTSRETLEQLAEGYRRLELVARFEQLWDEAQYFAETLMHEMQQSWAMAQVSPYDVYMKTLYELVKDRLEGAEDAEILWDDEITRELADFQKVAVRQAVQIIRDYGGAFVADVVGLGKSYMGAAVVKHFTRTGGARSVIGCPA